MKLSETFSPNGDTWAVIVRRQDAIYAIPFSLKQSAMRASQSISERNSVALILYDNVHEWSPNEWAQIGGFIAVRWLGEVD